jgi:hypothetical protein
MLPPSPKGELRVLIIVEYDFGSRSVRRNQSLIREQKVGNTIIQFISKELTNKKV